MNKKGFTLVELMAVIVVLGIIITIAVVNVIGQSKKTRNQMYETKVTMIEKAAELYGQDRYAEFGSEPKIVPIYELVSTNYIKKDDKNCTLQTNCVKDPRDNNGMDKKKVCICKINKQIEAELIDESKTDCSGTVCDPNNLETPGQDPSIGEPPLPPAPTQYTLTYESQGGSSCSSKTVESGSSWGTLCTPTRNGYNFGGWWTAGYGTEITSSTIASGNLTVYAKWSQVQYTITYNNQGGSGCTNKTVESGSTWGTLCTPTKTGYNFGGWYTGTIGSGTRVLNTTTASNNLTVYAKWNPASYNFSIYVDKGEDNITGYSRTYTETINASISTNGTYYADVDAFYKNGNTTDDYGSMTTYLSCGNIYDYSCSSGLTIESSSISYTPDYYPGDVFNSLDNRCRLYFNVKNNGYTGSDGQCTIRIVPNFFIFRKKSSNDLWRLTYLCDSRASYGSTSTYQLSCSYLQGLDGFATECYEPTSGVNKFYMCLDASSSRKYNLRSYCGKDSNLPNKSDYGGEITPSSYSNCKNMWFSRPSDTYDYQSGVRTQYLYIRNNN